MSKRSSLTPPAVPTPKRTDSMAIVDAIVEATLGLGVDVTMSTIAERAGVGIASLYRYFPNRQAIYAEISRRLRNTFLENLRHVLAQPGLDLRTLIFELCRSAIEVPKVSTELRQAINLNVPALWSHENAAIVFKTAAEEVSAWLHQRLEHPPDDLQERVFLSFAAGRGVVIFSQHYPGSIPPDEKLITHMARASLAYLQLDDESGTP